ncbi:hypothetical protein [Thioclava kandeliae]|uniref:Uncharacterized protein n=1 Tax=Thioclava kandeliae TaxID=3070818 RepID=A0ABV1SG05_9RHOB
MLNDQIAFVQRCITSTLIIGGAFVLTLNILGWIGGIEQFVRFHGAAMMPSTATCIALLFLGSATALSVPAKNTVAAMCCFAATAIAAINMSLRTYTDIDLDSLVPNRMAGDRMSEGTVLCILVGAAAIFSLASTKLQAFELHLAIVIVGIQLVIAVLILCSFMPGTPECPRIFQSMSFYTAACFVMLFAALFVTLVILPLMRQD